MNVHQEHGSTGSIRRILFSIAVASAQCLLACAQQPASATSKVVGKIEIQQVQGRVYMLSGAGANITVQVGDNAVYVVDAGLPAMTDQVLAAIRQLSSRPIAYIIDTNADSDHAGGNANLAKAGKYDTGQPGERSGAGIGANLKVLNRLTAENRPLEELPTDTFEKHPWALFNDEALVLTHAPAAHSDGDTYVFFRRSDVISTGDLFNPSLYPVVRADQGGTVDGIIDALNDIIAVMVPRENEEGGTYLIPGHGRVCDRTDIVNYRDAITIIRARIRDMVTKGSTLEQVKAAKPSADYDGIYGSDSGDWTTAKFIEAIYNDAAKGRTESAAKAAATPKAKRAAATGGKQP
jgi:cyclase